MQNVILLQFFVLIFYVGGKIGVDKWMIKIIWCDINYIDFRWKHIKKSRRKMKHPSFSISSLSQRTFFRMNNLRIIIHFIRSTKKNKHKNQSNLLEQRIDRVNTKNSASIRVHSQPHTCNPHYHTQHRKVKKSLFFKTLMNSGQIAGNLLHSTKQHQ